MVSQQNSNSPSNSVSQGNSKPQTTQGVKNSPYPSNMQSRNTATGNKQNSTTSTPQKSVQQSKEVLKSSPLETKKEDPKPSQKPVAGGGIASKMAFFNNQANSQNISTKSPQTKETPKPTPKIEEPKKDTIKSKTEEPKPAQKITETKNEISNPKLIQEDAKKQTIITKTVEIKKEDTKPVQKSATSSGFAAKMAFFNNQINSQSKSPQIKETSKPKINETKKETPNTTNSKINETKKETSTFTNTKIEETSTPTSKIVDVKKETSNITKTKIEETSTKKSPEVKQETTKTIQKSSPSSTTTSSSSSSGGGGFAAKMAFFNNQINSQSKPPQNKETSTTKPKFNETKKETSTVANTKANETLSNKSSEMKSETQKQPATATTSSTASSTSNSSSAGGGFASKMAFFKNQTNQGSVTNEPPTQQSKPPSKFSDRLAMFNNMNQPIGRPLERRGGPQASSNAGYRSKRSQTLMTESTPTMMKDSIAVTIAKDDTCIDTPPQGIAVRRKVRGATTRRRPTLLPDE